MIVDYPGPPGPLGPLEMIGWWAVCIFVALGCAKLMDRWATEASNRFGLLLAAIIMPVGLTLLLIADIQPTTPLSIKWAVEVSLQVVGLAVFAWLILKAAHWVIRLGNPKVG